MNYIKFYYLYVYTGLPRDGTQVLEYTQDETVKGAKIYLNTLIRDMWNVTDSIYLQNFT